MSFINARLFCGILRKNRCVQIFRNSKPTSVSRTECNRWNDGLQSALQVLLPPAPPVPRHLQKIVIMQNLNWMQIVLWNFNRTELMTVSHDSRISNTFRVQCLLFNHFFIQNWTELELHLSGLNINIYNRFNWLSALLPYSASSGCLLCVCCCWDWAETVVTVSTALCLPGPAPGSHPGMQCAGHIERQGCTVSAMSLW